MRTTPYVRATWDGMDWYPIATFFIVLGTYLSFVVPLTGSVPFVDISPSTAVIVGVACWIVAILQRLEAILGQISHIDFDTVCRRPAVQAEVEVDIGA